MHKKTLALIEAAREVLAEHRPMTLRQCYYQLVSRQALENRKPEYDRLGRALVNARKDGLIPWEWIEDRLRRPREVSMWNGLPAFADGAVLSYRLDVWESQPCYIEAWLEKDALSGIFEGVLDSYGVTLNVGRGYDGWSSLYAAAERFGSGADVTVLYFGDFDPSGDDMVRSLRERLGHFGCHPEVVKCALTAEDVERYQLPPDPAKRTDTRSAAFMAKHGDVSVELDALPPRVLRDQLVAEVENRMDLDALAAVKAREATDRERLLTVLGAV